MGRGLSSILVSDWLLVSHYTIINLNTQTFKSRTIMEYFIFHEILFLYYNFLHSISLINIVFVYLFEPSF